MGSGPDLLIHRGKAFSQGPLSNSFVFQTHSLTPWLFHCISVFFLSGENGPAFSFLCSKYWREKKKNSNSEMWHFRASKGCGEKNGKLRLCKHMEKNELLMHLVSFIYILPSVPNGLPVLWTPDDSVALCQGVFFLEPELDYASISKWQIKNGKLNPAVRVCYPHQFRAG